MDVHTAKPWYIEHRLREHFAISRHHDTIRGKVIDNFNILLAVFFKALRLINRSVMLLRKHLYRGRSKLIASALWLIRLSENSLHLISAVIKLFQRWYGKIRRTHEDYFH